MALTFEKKSPEPTLGFQKKEPTYAPRGGGAAIALAKKNKTPVAEYAPGIAGFENASDAAMFATKFGLTDTLNGAIQLIPGDWGEANMARDWKRLEYAMEHTGQGIYFQSGTFNWNGCCVCTSTDASFVTESNKIMRGKEQDTCYS